MKTVTLYRPVGQPELDLIIDSGYKAFPPRLSWQPIFYPVLNVEYAGSIAKEWNTNDDANGNVGYVTQFEIPEEYLSTFNVHNVGARHHNELWVPAEQLEEFNAKIVNGIRVLTAFYGEKFKGEKILNSINYIKGDATKPVTSGNKIIVHVCNDAGGWGKGFVLAISKRWPEPEKAYRDWFKNKIRFVLGEAQLVKVEDDLWVANLIGQHKMNKDEHGNAPIRYEAIEQGLETVAVFAKEVNASVHMPRIGCGLAGGTWDKVEPLITKTLIAGGVPVTVYDF